MKLPDFTQFEPLNKLRKAMGAELINSPTLTKNEIEELNTIGIDISPTEVSILDDGTLAYKNNRVILYIRDVNQHLNKIIEDDRLSRFHVSFCKTLESMFSNNRKKRYVVATRDDGLFALNIITGSKEESRTERLKVCQNCLDQLQWEGFLFGRVSKKLRRTIVSNFSLSAFFTKYPKSLISDPPDQTDTTAPINKYSDDWEDRVNIIKRERGYRCENAC